MSGRCSLLVATVGVLVQQFAVVHWPELQSEEHRGEGRMTLAVIQALLMALVLVLTIAVPAIGLWSLLLLLVLYPIGWARIARHRGTGPSGER